MRSFLFFQRERLTWGLFSPLLPFLKKFAPPTKDLPFFSYLLPLRSSIIFLRRYVRTYAPYHNFMRNVRSSSHIQVNPSLIPSSNKSYQILSSPRTTPFFVPLNNSQPLHVRTKPSFSRSHTRFFLTKTAPSIFPFFYAVKIKTYQQHQHLPSSSLSTLFLSFNLTVPGMFFYITPTIRYQNESKNNIV